MNRIGLTAAAALLTLGGACARHAKTPETAPPGTTAERAEGPGARRGPRQDLLLRGIELSADQRARMDAIRAKYRAQREGLDPRTNPDDRQKMFGMMQRQRDEIRAILTADQQKLYDQNLAELRDRMQQRRGRPGSP
jgi:Spy/CpxP family protein refolding chaperone